MNPETLEPDPDNAGVGIGERIITRRIRIFLALRFLLLLLLPQKLKEVFTNANPIPS